MGKIKNNIYSSIFFQSNNMLHIILCSTYCFHIVFDLILDCKYSYQLFLVKNYMVLYFPTVARKLTHASRGEQSADYLAEGAQSARRAECRKSGFCLKRSQGWRRMGPGGGDRLAAALGWWYSETVGYPTGGNHGPTERIRRQN
jgi:hypothetical protein